MGKSADSTQNACTPARVKEMAAEGWGRNAIAEQLEVTTYRVDQAAREAGVSFDRSMTREATQARVLAAQAERLELGDQLREVARVLLADLLHGDHRDLPTHEVKDKLWGIGSVIASDVRLAQLAIREAEHDRSGEDDSEAKEQFGALLESIRSGFDTLDEIPLEELEDGDPAEMIDFSD